MSWHADPAFRALAGDTLRPGGLELTDRAVALLELPRGSRVLDAACGQGGTVAHLRRAHGLDAVGVDMVPAVGCCQGRMEALPFIAGVFDAVVCECGLSLAEDRSAALAEFRRVLKTDGRLAVADVYDAAGLDDLAVALALADFSLTHFEDHTRHLARLAGRMVLAGLSPDCGSGLLYGILVAARERA